MSWLTHMHAKVQHKLKTCDDLQMIDGLFAANFVLTLSEPLAERYGDSLFDLLAVVHASLRDGHTCVALSSLANSHWFQGEMHHDEAAIKPGIVLLDAEQLNEMLSECLPALPEQCFMLDGDKFYLQRYWQFEQEITELLLERLRQQKASSADCEKLAASLWPTLFPGNSLHGEPQDLQQLAVYRAMREHTLIINGGPGTGKTYTAARVLALLSKLSGQGEKCVIKLAAPTGKAAQRLTESIVDASSTLDMAGLNELSAITLHRLLGLKKGLTHARYNQQNPLACDVLLVDEASMIDTAMMARLFRALSPHTRLILLGDANQLPSVEAGSVLGDLVEGLQQTRYANAVVTLTQSRRFSGELGQFASLCLRGASDDGLSALANASSLSWIDESPSLINLKALAMQDFLPIKQATSVSHAFEQARQVRWLTPFRRGDFGVEGLNQRIEHWLFSRRLDTVTGSHYKGRMIMVKENHSGSGLFNGDVGIIWSDEQGRLAAFFESSANQLKQVALSRLPAVESAFAMTIHKSQGSEFSHPRLILAEQQQVTSQAWKLVSRSLIYTAITRAKQGLGIVATAHSLAAALTQTHPRMSGLVSKIKAC